MPAMASIALSFPAAIAWTCAVTVPSGGAIGAICGALGRCACSSASTPGGTRGDGAPAGWPTPPPGGKPGWPALKPPLVAGTAPRLALLGTVVGTVGTEGTVVGMAGIPVVPPKVVAATGVPVAGNLGVEDMRGFTVRGDDPMGRIGLGAAGAAGVDPVDAEPPNMDIVTESMADCAACRSLASASSTGGAAKGCSGGPASSRGRLASGNRSGIIFPRCKMALRKQQRPQRQSAH